MDKAQHDNLDRAADQIGMADGILNAVLNTFDEVTLTTVMPPDRLYQALRAAETFVGEARKAASAPGLR